MFHIHRFRLYTLCADDSGTVPIKLENELVIQLCGKTVYDIAADEDQVQKLIFCLLFSYMSNEINIIKNVVGWRWG